MIHHISKKTAVALSLAISFLTTVSVVQGRTYNAPNAFGIRQSAVNPVASTVRLSDVTAIDVKARVVNGGAVIREVGGRVVDYGVPELMIDREKSDEIVRALGVTSDDVGKQFFDSSRRIFVWKSAEGTEDAISFGGLAASIAYSRGVKANEALAWMNDSSIIGLLDGNGGAARIKTVASSLDFGNAYIAIPSLLKVLGAFGATNVSENGFSEVATKGGWILTNSAGQKLVRADAAYAFVLFGLTVY
jgi:hypothetical protein